MRRANQFDEIGRVINEEDLEEIVWPPEKMGPIAFVEVRNFKLKDCRSVDANRRTRCSGIDNDRNWRPKVPLKKIVLEKVLEETDDKTHTRQFFYRTRAPASRLRLHVIRIRIHTSKRKEIPKIDERIFVFHAASMKNER